MAKNIKFKEGDPIEIQAVDHTSDDSAEGWRPAAEAMKSTPHTLWVRGYYVGEDAATVKVAFAKCDGHYSTIFNVAKGTILVARH